MLRLVRSMEGPVLRRSVSSALLVLMHDSLVCWRATLPKVGGHRAQQTVGEGGNNSCY